MNGPACNCKGCQAHQSITTWERLATERLQEINRLDAVIADGPLADWVKPYLAEAWDEGIALGIDYGCTGQRTGEWFPEPTNPYRAAQPRPLRTTDELPDSDTRVRNNLPRHGPLHRLR